MTHHIVVLGAGYSGQLAAKLAAKRTGADVTLINAHDRFVERVRLHQLAAGQPLRDLPIRDLLRGTNAELVVDHITAVDPTQRTVRLAHGRTVTYDTLIYALGSQADTDSPCWHRLADRSIGWRPHRIPSTEPEKLMERRCILRHGHRRPEQAGHALWPRRGSDEPEARIDAPQISLVGLGGRAGQIPAMQHELVECHNSSHGGGHLDAAYRSRPGSRCGSAPGRDKGVKARGQRGTPVRLQRRRAACRRWANIWRLLRAAAERRGEPEQVAEQITDSHFGTRGGSAEPVVGDTREKPGDTVRGGSEIHKNGHVVTTTATARTHRSGGVPRLTDVTAACVETHTTSPVGC